MAYIFNKISILILTLPVCLSGQMARVNYTSSSVLSEGKWFKIAILEDGVYRIDFSKLKQLGLSNPNFPRLFGNNSGQLSFYNDNSSTDDLKEISVFLEKGDDGIFNEGDYLLFYGMATHRWIFNSITGEYSFLRHNYSDTAFYFLTIGTSQGKTIPIAIKPSGPINNYSTESDALFIHENENENLIKSGREWYQPVTFASDTKINPGFEGLDMSEPLKFDIRLLARASIPTIFRLIENESIVGSIEVPGVNLSSSTGTYAQIVTLSGESYSSLSSPEYRIRFINNGEISAKGWLDYFKLRGRKHNIFSGETCFYSDSRSVEKGNITEFTINSSVDGLIIWDVTDPYNVEIIPYKKSAQSVTFSTVTDSLKTFMGFLRSKAKTPLFRSNPIKNQNLHASAAADMIILCHPEFRNYAEKLAYFHLKNSGIISLIVTPEQVYNEFSGGIPDIAGLRNFIRMKYLFQKNTEHPLKYLLLFGDGSYENKSMPPDNPNFIPTYQSKNSNVYISSFTSDDFYGLLDEGEGEDTGDLDIGIGRLPATDTIQAGILVSKIINYSSVSNSGDWKNVVCLVADDEDGNTHLSDAEGLSKELSDSVPWINISKIYFDSFKQVTGPAGQSYPDVTKQINERINEGVLIFNYTGHGNETSLAHERVVTTDIINQWKNGTRLPLFITATCEFSRFDNIEINPVTGKISEIGSAGEKILMRKNAGGIALMSTTRLAYSAPNYALNKSIMNIAFKRDDNGNPLRLGDIIRLAKNSAGGGSSRRNFHLLGDPAVRLAYPWHGKVVTDSINGVSVNETTDTLKALSVISVSGHVENMEGIVLNDFNGPVIPKVFDKPVLQQTLANDGGEKTFYNVQKNLIFSGITNANHGRFRFTFLVPRYIDFNFGEGKISYYAYNATQNMTGYYEKIITGGFNNAAATDTAGPEIKLYMNDTLFRDGGITDPDPILLVLMQDDYGINASGKGIGHDIVCWLDNDRGNAMILNSYFQNESGTYTKGSISVQLTSLTSGHHTITLKAWDNFNNSSEKSLDFFVEKNGKFVLNNLLNYPNPFSSETRISVGHNRPFEELEIVVKIFDISGRVIKIIRKSTFSSGYQTDPVVWDGTSSNGGKAGRGLYPFNVTINTGSGETATISGRMIIL